MDARVTLIGTGHVFRIEETVQEAIHALRPDVVAIELDRGRLQALLYRRKTGKMPEGKGNWIQRKLQAYQESVAKQYGSDVGGEMLGAYHGALEIGAKVALIDRPADGTLKRALKQLTWRERLRAVGLMFSGGIRTILPIKPKGDLEGEIQKYSEDPLAALAELRDKFPTIYKVVIAERDALMASNIRRIVDGRPPVLDDEGNPLEQPPMHVVAVVGDGHMEGMMHLLSDADLTAYRLPDVREGKLPRRLEVSDDGQTASFSFET